MLVLRIVKHFSHRLEMLLQEINSTESDECFRRFYVLGCDLLIVSTVCIAISWLKKIDIARCRAFAVMEWNCSCKGSTLL